MGILELYKFIHSAIDQGSQITNYGYDSSKVTRLIEYNSQKVAIYDKTD